LRNGKPRPPPFSSITLNAHTLSGKLASPSPYSLNGNRVFLPTAAVLNSEVSLIFYFIAGDSNKKITDSPVLAVVILCPMSPQIADPKKDPPCPECGAAMSIVLAEPVEKADTERRTYECPVCRFTETVVVAVT
jgi:hypothetical protein